MKKFFSFLSNVKTWQLFIALVVLVLLSAYFMRQNNLTMLDLRDEVVRIDEKTGDIDKVEPSLLELRSYILTHMNTEAGSIELVGVFNADVEAARVKAERMSGGGSNNVYARAQGACEKADIPITVRAQCIQDFILANASDIEIVDEIDFPPKEEYIYTFASPVWSLGLAGISVFLSIFVLFWILIRLFVHKAMPRISRTVTDDPLE